MVPAITVQCSIFSIHRVMRQYPATRPKWRERETNLLTLIATLTIFLFATVADSIYTKKIYISFENEGNLIAVKIEIVTIGCSASRKKEHHQTIQIWHVEMTFRQQ